MFQELLEAELAPYGTLSKDQLEALEEHYNLLSGWNKKLNLTRITRLEDVVRLHYCESLFLARALPAIPLRIVDVGSGAGFPGVPVAVYRPDCTVDLVESHQRKAVFLTEACRHLQNVRVLARRAESCDKEYDWLISRAVRPEQVVSLGLASNVALLMGAEDALGLEAAREEIPWGKNRVLAMFHVKHAKI